MNKLDEDTILKLRGLKALAIDYNGKIQGLRDLAQKLCGEPTEDYGPATEFIHDDTYTIDDLIKYLPTPVEEDAA